MEKVMYEFNEYLSSLEELNIDSYPEEVLEQFYDFINNVPYIKFLISKDRPHAKDLPRDSNGKILFDVTKPPILDDMDYFRLAAIKYNKTGRFTDLRPNPNPNSEYGKWIREEIKRCYEGMVRPSDGMWITGDMYFFLNYWPIALTKLVKGSKKGERIIDFPETWEGINSRFHYIQLAVEGGMYSIPKADGSTGGDNGCEISSRGKSKSYTMSSMMGKRFVLGESKRVNKSVKCMATAYQKQYLTSDGILNKFLAGIDFLALNTLFPKKRLKSSLLDMSWKMGYLDLDTGTQRGTLNEVIGVSAKDDSSKVRGKRQNLIVIEEFGSFKNVLELYNILIPSVQEGDISFGTMYLIGTAGDDESDFQGALEIVYNPDGYRMYGLPNVFDKEGLGRKKITFFFPGYINRKGCYDKDGNSDVTKALLEILVNRYRVKYNSTDINSITKTIAEIPITPLEAILRTRGNLFPVTQLNERLIQIDSNPKEYDDVYIGNLFQEKDGSVSFKPSNDLPIRDFPLKDNKAKGAIEIFEMPLKGRDGKIPTHRYILGHDPVDDDSSGTMSLTSTFVLDLFTDRIVAEYTGRLDYADDNFEIVRLLCLFYNAKCLYEQNKKGIFAYFSRLNCVHLLADTPEYLRDKLIIKDIGYGNKAHPYSANVYTPDGIKKWGDIKVGDTLYGTYGNTTKVIDIPFDDITDIYQITLKDGRIVEASTNHLWNVVDWNNRKKILSTKEILSNYYRIKGKYKEFKYYIESNEGVCFLNKEIPLPAYFLGLMLGDGNFKNSRHHNACFASSLGDMEEYKKLLPYKVKTVDDRHHWIRVPNIGNILSQLSLIDTNSYTKFIPDLYKYNSKEVRIDLLRGLLDTDGCVGYGGNPEYVSVSYLLAKDTMEVARSLGINCNLQVSNNKYGKLYKVRFYTSIRMFNLSRKYTKLRVTKTRDSKTAIINIKYVGKKLAKCVTVDSLDNCYLIEDFISTHNSKGVNATLPVNNFANKLIKDWLIKPVPTIIKEDGEDKEVLVSNLYFLKNRALIKELVLFNPDINVDRVRALGMVMLYREEFMILYLGNMSEDREEKLSSSYLGNDDYFTKNYNASKFSKNTLF